MIVLRRAADLGLILAFCLVVTSCGSVGQAEPGGATNATVVRVVDGDTVDIRHDDRGRLRVRIIGINAPETKIS